MEKNKRGGKPVHQLPGSPLELPQYRWYEDSERNKPQSNSLGAATFIFASGGMSLSCSAGFYLSYDNIISGSIETHMQVCWFVAVIIGAIIAAIFTNQLTKRMFNLLASILVVINGIIFVSASTSIIAATIARYCDGIAFGLTIITAITAGSEQSVKRFRGLVLSIESVGISLGILFKIVCFSIWAGWSHNVNELHGVLAIILGAVALLFTFFLTIESPIFYLRRNEERAALECLRRLQKPHKITIETYSLLDEDKKLLNEDFARGTEENIRIGLIPMGKLCLFRVLVSMSFSLPLTYALLEATNVTEASWSILLYGIMRLLGTCFAIFSLDTLGRRQPTVISLFLGGGLLLAVGIIFSTFNYDFNDQMQAVIGLMMVYQLCAGIVAPAGTTYLGEAFSISVKPYFILAAVICENFVQIIIHCNADSSIDSIIGYCAAIGTMQMAFALAMPIALPETKKTTLRESLNKFRKFIYIPAWDCQLLDETDHETKSNGDYGENRFEIVDPSTNVEAVILQNQVDTLQWQLKQAETSCGMYRAVMEEVARFLDRFQNNSTHSRNEQISRSKSMHHVYGGVHDKGSDSGNSSAYLRARSSTNLIDLKRTTSPSPCGGDSTKSSGDDHYDLASPINSYNTFKDFTWRRSPKKRGDTKLSPSDEAEEKLTKEAFRLSRTIHNLLHTQQPDLTQHRQSLGPRIKPISNASAITETAVHQKANLAAEMIFLRNMRDSRLSLRSSTDSSVHSTSSSSKVETDEENYSPPLLSKQCSNLCSTTEDESGFSSISSFHDIGIPLSSTMIASSAGLSHLEDTSTIEQSDFNLDSRNSTLKAVMHTTSSAAPANNVGVPVGNDVNRWDSKTYRKNKFQRFSTLSNEDSTTVLWV